MRPPIDPLVDYAFKRVFGTEENLNLLLHFLNAVLKPAVPLTSLSLESPFNEREFATDKLSVVDVKARDADGATYQVEIQVARYGALPQRMLFTWADIYQAQILRGDGHDKLRRVHSIWLLDAVLLPQSPQAHHRFGLYDPRTGLSLTDHLDIHLLELPKWRPHADLDDQDRWVLFLKHARGWTEVPEAVDTPEIRQAMSTLKNIYAKDADYWAYAARRDYLWEQAQIQRELEEQRAENKRLRAEAERAKLEAAQEAQAKLDAQAQELDAKDQELDAKAQELSAQAQELSAQAQELSAKDQELDAQAKEIAALRAALRAKAT